MSYKALDRLAMLALALIGAVSFVNLRAFPIFVDESINLWWLYRLTDFGEWLRPMGDGKPLEVWPVVPLVWLGLDTLTCMRALHVMAGIATTLLVYLLVAQFNHRAIACASALLTAVCPWIVFFQRMALADTFLCAAGMLVLYAAIRFAHRADWFAVTLLGVSLPLAAMAKLPVGFIFMAAVPPAPLWMPATERSALIATAKSKILLAYAPVILLLCLTIAVALVQMQRGQAPGFGLRLVLEKTVAPDRLGLLLSNLARLGDEFLSPLAPPLVAVMIVGVLASLWRGGWHQRWLAFWGIASLTLIVFVSSFWGSRYYLFTIPPLIISAVCGWQLLLRGVPGRGRIFAALALLIPCVTYMAYQSALRIIDPPSARWSKSDWGYITSWSSGYGYPELAQYLQTTSNVPPVIYTLEVGTAMQLRAYLPSAWLTRVQQLQIVDGQYLNGKQQQDYALAHRPAWLVTHSALDTGDNFAATHLQRIAGFTKPHSQVKVTLYQVVP